MTFQLPELPYAMDSLAPYISQETLEYHYGKHHRAYVTQLNKLVTGTVFADMTLEEIIKESSGAVFNNAGQIWNHTFYWSCLSPQGGGEPHAKLHDSLVHTFGSVVNFKDKFTQAAIGTFGSGWAWLVQDQLGELSIISTSNAGTPLTQGLTALLTCDVWEHAYYIDYRNVRADYLNAFWSLVNWSGVSDRLK